MTHSTNPGPPEQSLHAATTASWAGGLSAAAIVGAQRGHITNDVSVHQPPATSGRSRPPTRRAG